MTVLQIGQMTFTLKFPIFIQKSYVQNTQEWKG